MGALLAIGLVAAGVAAASKQPAPVVFPGTARLIPGDAAVTVHRGTPVAAADALLRAGDTLVVDSGIAALRTSVGTIFANAGTEIAITNAEPRVTRGDVLVQGNDMSVGMRAANATVSGIARIRQGLTLELDNYRGSAVVRSATETVGVPRLRRAVVSGNGASLITVAPLVINGLDKWDRKFLGAAIELDSALSARSRGLTMQVSGDVQNVVDKVVAETGFGELTLLPNAPVGEFVVAAELARAAHLGEQGVASVLDLRSKGASWGLIALEQGLRSLPATLAGIDAAAVPVGSADAVAAHVPAPDVPTVPLPPVNAPKTPVTAPPVKQPTTSGDSPVVSVPPTTDPVPANPVNTLVEGLDNLLGGLLGH